MWSKSSCHSKIKDKISPNFRRENKCFQWLKYFIQLCETSKNLVCIRNRILFHRPNKIKYLSPSVCVSICYFSLFLFGSFVSLIVDNKSSVGSCWIFPHQDKVLWDSFPCVNDTVSGADDGVDILDISVMGTAPDAGSKWF